MQKILASLLLALAAFSTGCSMSDNCYDYSGPVIDEGYAHGPYEEHHDGSHHAQHGGYGAYGEEHIVPGSEVITEGTAPAKAKAAH